MLNIKKNDISYRTDVMNKFSPLNSIYPASKRHSRNRLPDTMFWQSVSIGLIVLFSIGFLLNPIPAQAQIPAIVVTNANDSGPGSLRQAIDIANSNPDQNAIVFNIAPGGAQTINLQSGLPRLETTMIIDATTQPGFAGRPIIELNGSNANSSGLEVNAGNCVIKGLVINRFVGHGIVISGNTTTISGNYIGTNLNGDTALPVGYSSVFVIGSGNMIGGTTPEARNVLSGNGHQGVALQNTSGNKVQGNYIGTDATGTIALGGGGISVFKGASDNVIGGASPEMRNVISGNRGAGITINIFEGEGATRNMVQGNYVGLKANGNEALPNQTGITLTGVSNNTLIGNIVSGNRTNGILFFRGANSNTVIGNRIGTSADGALPVPNANGIILNGSSNNVIGAPGAGNLISGNAGSGIAVTYLPANPANGTPVALDSEANLIQSNTIGLKADGTSGLGNAFSGIVIAGANNNIVGGKEPGKGNLVAFNRSNITVNCLVVNSAAICSGNTMITGNSIVSASVAGVTLTGALNTAVGGMEPGMGNTIAFNSVGVSIECGSLTCASGVSVLSNSIHSNTGEGIRYVSFNGQFPNENQSAPNQINIGFNGSSSVSYIGQLVSAPNANFNIQLFSNETCDESGAGEGKTYLGSTGVTTGGNGVGIFSFTGAMPNGAFITATATGAGKSTSRFSQCFVSPAYGIQQLINSVNAMVMAGAFSPETANPLLGHLDNALKQFERGQSKQTVQQLEAFINKVDQSVQTGKMAPAQGQALREAAIAIIRGLQI